MIESFEWLRPGWLAVLPAAIVLLWVWWRGQAGHRLWRRLVDAELLEHLSGVGQASSARLVLGIALALLVLACCALAGPVWHANSPQRVDLAARIVVLDLSPSMDAIDVAPSRMHRARAATAALLRGATGVRLGVVVFGADAFSVAPLMSDAGPLVHLVAGVGPATVPRAGSRPDLGLEMARTMLKQADVARGEVILVADGAGDARTLDAARALARSGFPVSVLAVGTAHGGPIPLAGGEFARSESGEILIARAELAALEQVANSGGGRFEVLRASGEMPRFVAGLREAPVPRAAPRGDAAPALDVGAWLALIALPFGALLFRRGWLAGLAALALLPALVPADAHAFDWESLWRRTDQQAAAAFARGKPGDVARVLGRLDGDSPWHAMLLYRGGNFAEAAAQFATSDTAVAHYNRGNALALDGELEAAIAAYDAALARNPVLRDAQFNRALVRKALAERSEQPQQGSAERAKQQPKDSSSGGRARGAAGGRADPLDSASRRAPADARESAAQGPMQDERAQARARDARDAADPLGAEERDRLERLLSKVPDDPGSLLSSRFAQQLKSRGTPHSDLGPRW
ncbi:MAG TPA: VWA domain-containing protein [Burkholderiales bacterium]|nr:VWA domain-containing protein [Burkholderiales bacterium]